MILLLACTGTPEDPVPSSALTVSSDAVALGDVALGCSAGATVTLTNTSDDPLIVSAVDGTDDTLSLQVAVEPPWELLPGTTLDVALAWTPALEGTLDTTLTFQADLPLPVRVTGQAAVESDGTATFTTPEPTPITSLLAFHYYIASDPRLLDMLPTYFATLRASGAPFRVAFLHTEDGRVSGKISFIDDSFTDEQAVTSTEAMLASASGDNDYLMQTLANGLVENAGWLFSPEWEDARLALVGGNPDLDQSTGNSTTFLTEFQATKEDPSLVTVSHIGGDYPRGCGSFAVLSPMFYEAAEATGGVYLSVCEPEWTDHAIQLAWNAAGPSPYPLEGSPAPATIAVRVDGVATDAWVYDTIGRAIRLDEHPGAGATIEVDYAWAEACD